MDVETDYTPGDDPVPVGSLVQYESWEWEVLAHWEPQMHPSPPPVALGAPSLEEAYPDGTAYLLWRTDIEKHPDNPYGGKSWVRRTSFRIVKEE